ncbi:ATP-dependent DNA helicase [Paenibacillus sp. HN-1]|uniref:helicase C-terminal domain-containing protein n=1 Tax=Paenibacillus TaxID=44249 RepID=UPI001CA9754E|nr:MULTISPECIES: helicase C-terminal domain-containing protein [Paenibacillus]MBY9077732.1 ATP-dependent DNA helicase [Paenibacillus sp. CGMCC 1.18879]MBY9083689.1 ATP-dependent DNA helicase [Paenibacillus sinensis]
MSSALSISVRALVEHVYKSGSLESGFRSAAALAEGTRIHQSIQRQYGEDDRKEVYLSADIPCGGLVLSVFGRCDGLLLSQDGGLTVEEIKSTGGPELPEEGREVHWAQAMMYAYMILLEQSLSGMRVRLTYVHTGTGEQRSLERQVTFAEAEAFAYGTAAAYAPYASLLISHAERRDESIRRLEFPFPSYRAGQRHLAGAVYKSVAEGVSLFAQAPTGIGKTISTLFPSVKAVGEGLLQSLFYLTAKTVTRLAAQEAFALMKERGLHMHTVTLTAKEKACFREEGLCGPEHCPFAEGYYDRINGALMDMLEAETLMDRSVLEVYARKHMVCPFELSLDAAYVSDAVICDYNYVFDPRISMKRLAEDRKKNTVLLVDEAHNLVDRGREMFSASLCKAPFLDLKRRFKGRNRALSAAAGEVNTWFIALRKSCGDEGSGVWENCPEDLPELLERFTHEAELELIRPSPGEAEEDGLLDVFYEVQGMLRTFKLYDERYVTYAEVRRGDVFLKLFNLDPSHLLTQSSKGFCSRILFSATLSPMHYYRDMLGAGEDDYSLAVPSPFDRSQWDVAVLPVSTRYQDREGSVAPLCRALESMASRKGNYLVFFPSYLYMQTVYDAFIPPEAGVRTLIQGSGMTEEEREAFLDAFSPNQEETLLGFAVMGGIFSEGVDLPGDRLNGVMVVGVGLPQLGLERNLLRDYFASRSKNGFDYAYVYPGMCKVLQAGGRLIRSGSDTGTIILADDRFLRHPYDWLLPEEWRDYRVLD